MKEAVIVCNGPSVENIQNFNLNNKDIIAVNRWVRVFRNLKLPMPKYVIIGINSIDYNLPIIPKYKNIEFYGINNIYKSQKINYLLNFNNYKKLHFGLTNIYNCDINCIDSLWWSGFYAIQLALQKEYDKIYIFGMTCNNSNDYKDSFARAHIPAVNMNRVVLFLNEIKKIKDYKEKIYVFENEQNLIRRVLNI